MAIQGECPKCGKRVLHVHVGNHRRHGRWRQQGALHQLCQLHPLQGGAGCRWTIAPSHAEAQTGDGLTGDLNPRRQAVAATGRPPAEQRAAPGSRHTDHAAGLLHGRTAADQRGASTGPSLASLRC